MIFKISMRFLVFSPTETEMSLGLYFACLCYSTWYNKMMWYMSL